MKSTHRLHSVFLVSIFAITLAALPANQAGAATFTVTSVADSGSGSLREAVEQANNETVYPGADTILFQEGLGGAITLESGEIPITSSMTIQGPGAGILSISGGGSTRAIRIAAGAAVSILGLTIRDGNADYAYYGGGIYNRGSLTLDSCAFTGNTAPWDGGAVINWRGTLNAANCTFTGNSALNGGAIANVGGTVAASRCVLASNVAGANGGAIANSWGTFSVSGCELGANSATDGGAIYNWGTVNASNTTFWGNGASGSGGAICCWSGTTTAINCAFSGNRSDSVGGAVASGYFALTLATTNCTFSANSAPQGGAIYNETAVSAANCILWGNTADVGASIYYLPGQATGSVTYSDVQGGWNGQGNISADPLFARAPGPGADATWGTTDDDYGDLRLQPGSPCTDAGSDSAVPAGVTTDLGGDPRFRDGNGDGFATVDMGAYERPPATVIRTPRQRVLALVQSVQALVADGALIPADGRPLYAKLNAALACLDAGNSRGAIDSLTAFANQLRALVRARRLSPAAAQPLIDEAAAIIQALG